MTQESNDGKADNVVPFSAGAGIDTSGETDTSQLKEGPHLQGACACVACEHKWQAAAPVGRYDKLECPACKGRWGTFVHPVEPPEHFWQCECGEELYWLTPDGAVCRKCGATHTEWVE